MCSSDLNTWPDWLEVDFNGSQTIGEIDVFSVQDNYLAPVAPTLGQTFSLYGLTDFQLQTWDGTQWVTIPTVGTVAGNNQVWKQVTFSPITTNKIRLYVTGALNQWSRLTEIEAWTAQAASQPPGAFAKSTPVNGATGLNPSSVALVWGTSTGATSYEIGRAHV